MGPISEEERGKGAAPQKPSLRLIGGTCSNCRYGGPGESPAGNHAGFSRRPWIPDPALLCPNCVSVAGHWAASGLHTLSVKGL